MKNQASVQKKDIYSVSTKKLSDQKFKLKINAEGGLPIKRFVNGDDIMPSVSSMPRMDCHADEFDFLDVKINDNN